MALEFDIQESKTETVVLFRGQVDVQVEETLKELERRIKTPRVRFDCEGISRLNSVGITIWLKALESLNGRTYSFFNCNEQFLDAAVMIPLFPGTGWIESIKIRYNCDGCQHTENFVLETNGERIPNVDTSAKCPKCTAELETDMDLIENLDTLNERGSFQARI
jgi:anti-anti-sigma regulatory factor